MQPGGISPDTVAFFESLPWLNATLFYTWIVICLLGVGSWLVTRRLSDGKIIGRWQNLLETVVETMQSEIESLSRQDPAPFLPFVGTLFLFILAANWLDVVPGFLPPTGSLSTTAALAVCVFFAVPIFGVANSGLAGYLKNYVRPSPFMLPFNIIGELSRTLALAVRLFGNIMSGSRIVGILVSLVGIILPVVMQFLGILIGAIQAYIFAVLAMVYISSGLRAHVVQQEHAKERAEAAEDSQERG